MARPSKYETEVKDKLIVIEGWARKGLTDEQIAKNIGINVGTLYEWKKKYPEFAKAIKKGKEVIDFEVENSLYKSAIGFYYTEEVVTNKGEVVTLNKYEKPNTTAMIFWLKNRMPKEWREKQDIEHSGEIGVKIVDNIPRDNK